MGHTFLFPGWGLAPGASFGNINHPGGIIHTLPGFFGHPFRTIVPPLVHPFPFRGTFTRFGGVRVGFLGGGFAGFGGFGFPGVLGVPVAVPVPVGYGSQQPTVIIIQQPAAQPGPSTVVAPPGPAPHAAGQPPVIFEHQGSRGPAPAAPSKPLTLVVLKDHTIYAVTDYWVEGERLHFVTSYGAYQSVPLDQLDLTFTRRLNEERNVTFELAR